MDRVAIIGCGGTGKSTMAEQMADLLDVSVTSLDELYYESAPEPMSEEDFAATQRELVGAPRWIIEGTYEPTLPIRLAAADTVVLLDPPALAGVGGIIGRWWSCGGRSLRGVRVIRPFIRYLVDRRTMRPRLRRMIAEHAGHARLVRLTGRRQARRFLDEIRGELAASGAQA